MSIRTKRKTRTGHFPASRLKVDPEVQRELVPARVRSLAKSMREEGIGVITISKRGDGSLVVLDGQHRIAALIQLGLGDTVVDCQVHEGLTIAEEADLFRLLNNTRAVNAYDDFDKGVKAGDPECLEIDALVKKHGLRVHNQTADGTIRAVSAMRKVYRQDPAALDRALKIATEAWGHTADATDGQIIAGLGVLATTYNGEIDDKTLVRKLARYPGGPSRLLGSAKGMRNIRTGTVPRFVAAIAVDVYNHGRKQKVAAL